MRKFNIFITAICVLFLVKGQKKSQITKLTKLLSARIRMTQGMLFINRAGI